jgi:hypothetical protein
VVILLVDDKDLFYVEVRNPNDVKRNVLEARKEIIEGLQRFENIKFLREKKIENIAKLKGIIKELSTLTLKLKNAFPASKIREQVIKPKKKVTAKKYSGKKPTKVQEQKKAPKAVSELEKLETELNDIESQLNSLQ